ncbi:MAG: TIGR03435 family protein [Bryobacterales bacterium]|nr:TIGR03435 family protein [Bryobacterales bacterium]
MGTSRGAACWLLPFMLSAALAQTPAARISIEPAAPGMPRRTLLGQDRFIASGITLDRLIAHAFETDPWKIVAPEWFQQSRYDVRADHEPGAGSAGRRAIGLGPDIRPALRGALTGKFSLVYHHETRQVEAWVMRLPGAASARLTPASPSADRGPAVSQGGTFVQLACKPCRFRHAVDSLRRVLGAELSDETDLGGVFDFSVMWKRGDPDSLIEAWREAAGIQLSREFRPAEVLVIDSAIRPDLEPPPPADACEAAPAIRGALDMLPAIGDYRLSYAERMGPRRDLARRYPYDLFVQMRLQETLAAMPHMTEEWARALDSYHKLENPVLRDLLVARLILPLQKVQSEKLLLGITEGTAEWPWAQLALAEWSRLHSPGDTARLEGHLQAFRRLCPESLAALRFAPAVRSPELSAGLARAAGPVLSRRVDGEAIAAYPLYWDALLAADPDAAPARIRADVARLRFLNRLADPGWLHTLCHGYGLLQDAASCTALQALAPPARRPAEVASGDRLKSKETAKAYLAAIERHPDLDDEALPAALQVAEYYVRAGAGRDYVRELVARGIATAAGREEFRRLSDVPAHSAAAEAAIAAAYRRGKALLESLD